ncbi:MAG: hypothetical protein ACI9QL_001714, partial [Candidatus Omnitrophota bacterium]
GDPRYDCVCISPDSGYTEIMPRKVKIFCPPCGWKPHAADRWFCSCGHAWNTFDTGGVCPACGHAWKITQCLSCAVFSPHGEWHHETDEATDHGQKAKKKQKQKAVGAG